jgi:ABC-2 type transport system ATP-binding protein
MEVTGPMDAAIEVANVSCRYTRHAEVVRDLTFAVRPGSIFALLGPNGAGKTTTIRVLMNMIRPARGVARVLGIETTRLGPRERAQIGYVSENQKLPLWMTVAHFLEYCRPFYPTWDERFSRALVEEFDLPLHTALGHVSRGMRIKAALVSALAFRPRVLVLDEPFSGLDPVMRDDLVRGVLQLADQEQWTVIVSSHDLDEVERLVDDVGFLDGGHLVLAEPFAELQGRFRSVEVTVADGGDTSAAADGGPDGFPEDWIGVTRANRVVRFVETRFSSDESPHRIREAFPGARIDDRPMTLREIFIALARHRRGREVSR